MFTEYSLEVAFIEDKEHMTLSVLSFISLQIRACHIVLSRGVKQRSFQGIDTDLVMNLSLKPIKGNLYLKGKIENYYEKKKIFEAKLC